MCVKYKTTAVESYLRGEYSKIRPLHNKDTYVKSKIHDIFVVCNGFQIRQGTLRMFSGIYYLK